MALKRYAAKRDTNEPGIIKGLRSVGATVRTLSEKGMGDLIVGYRGRNYLLEVKMPGEKLTTDEHDFHSEWQGQIAIVFSLTEAYIAIGALVE
jgi:hypothetical protein